MTRAQAERVAIEEAYTGTPAGVGREDLEASCTEVGDTWSCPVSTSSSGCSEYSLGTVTVDSSGSVASSDLTCNGEPIDGESTPTTSSVSQGDAEDAALSEAYTETPAGVERDDLTASCSEVGDSWDCNVSTTSSSCSEYSLGTVTVDASGSVSSSDLTCNGEPLGVLPVIGGR